MSVVQNPLIGRARQSIGGATLTSWKGINVLKSKPLTVANPNTINQQMRRSALSQITFIARILYSITFYGFKEQAVKKSQTNAFVGYNLRNSFNYTAPPAATLVPANVLVSQGTITPQAMDTEVADASDAEVTLAWTANTGSPGTSPTDIGLIGMYNETTDEWFASSLSATRADNAATIATPAGYITAGDTLHLYIFFANLTSRKSSDSVHYSITVQA